MVLRTEKISKRFGSLVALEDVSLDLRGGEITALIGDNGAGKSTFVKIISGVYRPSEGHIYFEGRKVVLRSAAEARRLGIETVHQDLGLVNSMSIARNFFLGLEVSNGPFLDIRRMESETFRMLSEIGLVNIRNIGQDVSRLSGGERQAISIGRALAFQKRMLILDEPTSALSVKETEKVFEYIRAAKQKGLAIVVVMHNLAQVRAIADRFVVFWHGKKTADTYNKGQSEAELSEAVLYGTPL